MNTQNDRLQWFLDRIGKRVFRNKTDCPCEICTAVYERGMLVENKMEAQYLYDLEAAYTCEGDLLRYFDTREEAREWEAQKAAEIMSQIGLKNM